jgi:amylosucrase
MDPREQLARQAQISLSRLLPRLEARYTGQEGWAAFRARLEAHFPKLFARLLPLYGGHYDFFYHLEQILEMAARMWITRSAELRALDAAREADPHWFQSEQMMGGVCYVDLFAGNLAGIREQIPYFKELGLTYLHLMPLFLAPAGDNDGGYAVSSYRDVNPALGTMEELAALATELRHNGISLVLDFVFNHTSGEHIWAQRAAAGEREYQDYYYIFPDRSLPDAYQAHLRDIFPDQRPGSFTWRPDIPGWVWTTFYSFQWDLNYANPVVFAHMAEEMLFLANQGVEVLRLDAVAFIWKKPGTPCESLPEVHLLVQAFNALLRIAAPALLFKSEAIVHPDEVVRYIGEDECRLSYNPLLMALLWNTLATRDVNLLQASLIERFHIDPACAWVNYVRSHDDIGWTFDDAVANRLWINGFDHRRFLNAFYTGRFPGSFARGLPFQENPRTGDARISGTAASLAGLEQACLKDDPEQMDLAIRRILLIYGVVLSIGGIPLLYFGDEVGTLNDYCYRLDPAKADDSRWVHRPWTDWERIARRADPESVEGRIYQGLRHLIAIRKAHRVFGGDSGQTEIIATGNPHVFGYVRQRGGARVLAFANFSEQEQRIPPNEVRLQGLSYQFIDLIDAGPITLETDLVLGPYRFVWLVPA